MKGSVALKSALEVLLSRWRAQYKYYPLNQSYQLLLGFTLKAHYKCIIYNERGTECSQRKSAIQILHHLF